MNRPCMTRAGLAWRGVRFYRRTYFGVLAGTIIGAAVLVGALLVGDSVGASLRDKARLRTGSVDVALVGTDRFVRAALADDLAGALAPAVRTEDVAPVLSLDGLAVTPDASHRANGVTVLGVDSRFFGMAVAPNAGPPLDAGTVLLNERLARQLDAGIGETVVLRLARPSAMPRDMVLAANDELSIALRVTVRGVLPAAAFGDFGLEANQVPPYNAFVDLEWLQSQLDLEGRANLLLVASADAASADGALRDHWTLDDAELVIMRRSTAEGGPYAADLVSRRVFIDDPVVAALEEIAAGASAILTYFVNELRAGERAAPYSMVTALGSIGVATGDRASSWPSRALVPDDLPDEAAVINRWLADDLGVTVGDEIEIRYFVLGPAQDLVEEATTFLVHDIIELTGAAADPTLMPAFPGLEDAENCRDWEPGIPVDLDRIRDEDEVYWDEHRGTPKAFITLAAGRRLWGNRFGALTAVRAGRAEDLEKAAATLLREKLDPAAVGLFFRDVQGPAQAASTSATDFGGLFLGLSIFLVISALLLIALLFGIGLEQRTGEIGLLLAVGFRPIDVRRLLLREAMLIALLGSVIGAAVGIAYTRLVLLGLATIWRDAVGATSIGLHARPTTIIIGVAAAFLSATFTLWFALRRQGRRRAAALLSGTDDTTETTLSTRGSAISFVLAGTGLLAALVIVVLTGADRGAAATGAFFAAGALVLGATVALGHAMLRRLARAPDRPGRSIGRLGVRNGARRAGRSLAVITLLACGSFLVLAVGANRLDAGAAAGARASGTGGFALMARSAIGIPLDRNDTAGRRLFGLDDDQLEGVAAVPIRVRAGDDASCLNLSLAQQPRLLGVDPSAFADRGAFTFAKTLADTDTDTDADTDTDPVAHTAAHSPWHLLNLDLGVDETTGAPIIPAVADIASLTWVMHKRVGDTLDYRDERGRPLHVRVVGAIANSVLQGNLIISERQFTGAYPSESGYGLFLIDAKPENADIVSQRLSRSLSDVGLEVTSTVTRLAEFNAVQNTYLAIFQLLGGLGLLLGSAGVGMVVLRNVLERRGELAVLRAVGFRARALRWLVFSEHGMLLALGLAGGTLAAFVAVLPALRSPSAEPPVMMTVVLLAAITVSGLFWVWLATAWGLRGRVVDALRDE